MNMCLNILAVACGGALGSVCRYLISLLIGGKMPYPLLGTLVANVLGTFIIGWAMTRTEGRRALMLTVGFCGGFTTFSTFTAQTLELFSSGRWVEALLYALVSVTACLAALAAAFTIFR